MFREDERTQANQNSDSRKKDGNLMRGKHLFPFFELLYQPIGNEYAEVITETEDESGDDDIDKIELQPEQTHNAEYPNPGNNHRKESDDGQFQSSITDKQ